MTVPDLLVPSGVSGVSGLSSLAIPSPSENVERGDLASPHLGDLPSALGVRRSPRGGRAEALTLKPRGDLLSATGSGARKTLLGRRSDADNRGADKVAHASLMVVGGPVKKRRPPRLQIASDNASPSPEPWPPTPP